MKIEKRPHEPSIARANYPKRALRIEDVFCSACKRELIMYCEGEPNTYRPYDYDEVTLFENELFCAECWKKKSHD